MIPHDPERVNAGLILCRKYLPFRDSLDNIPTKRNPFSAGSPRRGKEMFYNYNTIRMWRFHEGIMKFLCTNFTMVFRAKKSLPGWLTSKGGKKCSAIIILFVYVVSMKTLWNFCVWLQYGAEENQRRRFFNLSASSSRLIRPLTIQQQMINIVENMTINMPSRSRMISITFTILSSLNLSVLTTQN